MKIGFAQINSTVGDFAGNRDRIARAYDELRRSGADLVITPELAVTGYPPMDLLFKSRFVPACEEIVQQLQDVVRDGVPLVVGYAARNEAGVGAPFRNAAAVLSGGGRRQNAFKTLLPTYDVFDEARYFHPADDVLVFEAAGVNIGVTICEDVWSEKYLGRRFYGVDPVSLLVERGAELVINLSASPYHLGKPALRREMLAELGARHGVPFAYCNAVGGNDQLIFDGASVGVRARGSEVCQLAMFSEENAVIDFGSSWCVTPSPSELTSGDFPKDEVCEELHGALVLGLKDYFRKCGFRDAVLGLSGGIDSAVCACLAVDALGVDHVTGVALPSEFSSEGSITDARLLAENLGIRLFILPIQESFETMKAGLAGVFAGMAPDTTEENLQSRLRGVTLMALSNKFGSLLLTTGNKSELAVGYCTLYGDMCGGLAAISDLPKTQVYALARWINRSTERIPRASIEKPPSAELKPDQVDQDSLPPYDILDGILKAYVEDGLSHVEIVGLGFDPETVRWVQRRVDLNEYKRQQAAPGLRVTTKAFGFGRRVPIAQRFVE